LYNGSNSYNWPIPSDQAQGSDYRIYIKTTYSNYFSVSPCMSSVGEVQAIITPQAAIDAGAQWRVDGGVWRYSASSASATTGNHTISFMSIPKWITPRDTTVSVRSCMRTYVTGNYSPTGAPSVAVDNPPAGATLTAGGSYTMGWTVSSGSSIIRSFSLAYSTDNGASWSEIPISFTASSRTYTWNPIPSVNSSICKIRLRTFYNNGSDFAESFSGLFRITQTGGVKINVTTGKLTYSQSESVTFQITVKDNNNDPIPGMSIGVYDPISPVCTYTSPTSSSGYAEYRWTSTNKMGHYVFSFIYGSTKVNYAIEIDNGNPYQDGQNLRYVATSGSLARGQSYEDIELVQNMIANTLVETLTNPAVLITGFGCAGASLGTLISAGAFVPVAAVVCGAAISTLETTLAINLGKNLMHTSVDMMNISQEDKDAYHERIDVLNEAYGWLLTGADLVHLPSPNETNILSSAIYSGKGNSAIEQLSDVVETLSGFAYHLFSARNSQNLLKGHVGQNSPTGKNLPTSLISFSRVVSNDTVFCFAARITRDDSTFVYPIGFRVEKSQSFNASGRVTIPNSGLGGVTINLTGAVSSATTTDPNGYFTFVGVRAGTYSITPSKGGYTFSPASRTFAISGSDVSGLDFIGTETSDLIFWRQADGPYGGVINCVATNSRGDVFAGTGGGVYRSADNGATWTQTGLTNSVVNALGINSAGDVFAATYDGIFRSTDNGSIWTAVNTGLTYQAIVSLAIASNGHILGGTNGQSVYRSTDNGGTWAEIYRGLSIYCLAANSSGQVFAGTLGSGVFSSTDDGLSWNNVGLPNSFVSSFAINPSAHIFAGSSNGVYRSTDNGGTWTQIGLANVFVTTLGVNVGNHIFAGSAGGMYRSTDNGATWPQIGLGNYRLNAVVINAGGHVFAGTAGDGVFRSTDDGGTWVNVNSGLKAFSISSLATNTGGQIFAGGNHHVYRSTDNGRTWIDVCSTNKNVTSIAVSSSGDIFVGTYAGIYRSTDRCGTWTQATFANGVYAIAITPSGRVVAGGFDGIHSSTDNGVTWKQTTVVPNGNITALGVNLDGSVFAATNGSGVFRSTNGGADFAPANVGLTNPWVQSLAINTANGHVIVGVYGNGGIFRSTDKGDTWGQVAVKGLPYPFVEAFATLPNGLIFAGSDRAGVYSSTDDGSSWKELNTGLRDARVYSLVINSSGYVFAGTAGNGVFMSTRSITPVGEINRGTPSSFCLQQNYPNPFNPSTVIEFTLPQKEYVTLTVYSMLGQKLATLLDEGLTPGTHKVEWNARGCASGVYFCRLQAGQFVDTKKVVLVK
jgi:photosystem II stability/assembly factor-like uncharacterized protein